MGQFGEKKPLLAGPHPQNKDFTNNRLFPIATMTFKTQGIDPVTPETTK